MDKLFKCLSEPIRRQILDLLKSGEMSASEIASNFDVSKPTISHHLKVLSECELIECRRDKNTLYYILKTSVFEDVIAYFMKFKEIDEK